MYTLSHAPRSAATGVRALLEGIGVPYAIHEVDIDADRPRDPTFLRINPNGWVPAMVYEGGAMYEAAANRLDEIWQILDDALVPGPWLLGRRFSACDIYLYMLSTWLLAEHTPITEFPNAARCANVAAERPEVACVFG